MTLYELFHMSIFENFDTEVWCFDGGVSRREWSTDSDWSTWGTFLNDHKDWKVYGLNTNTTNTKLIIDIMR